MKSLLLPHPLKKLFMRRFLFILAILVISSHCYAQSDFSAATWRFIDTSVSNSRNLSRINTIVQQLKQKAFAEKKYFYVARCYHYQLAIADKRTEDTLFFRNSSFIDSLLETPGIQKELQIAMHVLQAKRLAEFSSKYKRFNRATYKNKNSTFNYSAFTDHELDSLAQGHYEQAKEIAKDISPVNIDEAIWLSSDRQLFLFKPAIYDIIIAEGINHADKLSNSGYRIKGYYEAWLPLSQQEFIGKLDSAAHTKISGFIVLKNYYEWINYNKANPSAYYYIEALARRYFYNENNYYFPESKAIYEDYLKTITASPYNTVKAFGIYQLCLLWVRQARQYFPSSGAHFDYKTKTYRDNNGFDTAYRYQNKKALELFTQNRTLFDSITYMREALTEMEEHIKENALAVIMQRNNLPGEPMLAELRFKNAGKIYYRIKRMNPVFKIRNSTREYVNKMLNRLPVVYEQTIDLPQMNDYTVHSTYFKIDAMPPGSYVLMYSHLPITDSNDQVEQLFFNFTSIAVVNSDNRIYVLDRKTGFPLAGAKVKGNHDPAKTDTLGIKPLFSRNYTVNNEGYIIVADKKVTTLDVFYKNDTLTEQVELDDEDVPEYVYSKEDYNDLAEFYEDNSRTRIFTDRDIYRPGQTVHFKAIFLTRNKNTGDAMVMSKENMEGTFGSVYDKWLKETKPELYVTDPFGRKMDSIQVKLNEYGSISGTFKIPKSAATGSWSIDKGTGGTFKVEEYKRPTYEITIEEPEKELLPGDSFSYKVKVRSFTGTPMSNVRVKYNVYRVISLGSLGIEKTINNYKEGELEITDTTGFTNTEGELIIPVSDPSLKEYKYDKKKIFEIYYHVSAEAIDAAGESYSKGDRLTVSSRPLTIEIPDNLVYNRNEKNSMLITASDLNAGTVSKNIHVKVFRYKNDPKIYSERILTSADVWLYDKEQLQRWFPDIRIMGKKNEIKQKELVLETVVNTGKNEKLELDPKIFIPGYYRIEAFCEDNGNELGSSSETFSVFDEKEKKIPEPDWSFFHLVSDKAMPGDTLNFYNGNSESKVYSIYHLSWYSGKAKRVISVSYQNGEQPAGMRKWQWKIPDDAVNSVTLTQVYIFNNELFTNEETITINNITEEAPEIIIEKYRKKLSPGSKETFSVSIKTKNVNTAAELMTTLYDASLDKLEKYGWQKPFLEAEDDIEHDWPSDINSPAYTESFFNERGGYRSGHIRSRELWWINPLSYSDEDVMGDWNAVPMRGNRFTYMLGSEPEYDGGVAYDFNLRNSFQHDMNPDVRWRDDDDIGVNGYNKIGARVNGLVFNQRLARNYERGNVISYLYCPSFSSPDHAGEVITTTVPFLQIGNITISDSYEAVSVKKITSLAPYRQSLIIIDGVIFTGDLGKIDPATITMGIVLKGADAAEIYGPAAANGVLVLSTKGEILFPSAPPAPIPVRKNFNETAFFFPAVYADKDGYYNFTFTMPESVTEWNWKLMAHTKKAQFAYAERTLNTQLPLMVQPNMPRLLYQGDRIVLQSRITNLDSAETNGKTICKIEDAVTGEDITTSLLAKSQNDFSIGKKGNIASAFEIKVPATQLNPVKILISVQSQNFADGEEHIIPVLSPKVLVKESIPFRISKNMDTAIQSPALPAGAELYGTGISILSKPQSALINALPYLANYSFDCAEQTFNKLVAHATALKIMQTDKQAQGIFNDTKQKPEQESEQKESLPDELSEETMPWLNLSNKTRKQQKQLFELLDTIQTKRKINDYSYKIRQLQNGDGGLAWFKDGKSDDYISNYILAGIGKLKKEGMKTAIERFEDRLRTSSFIDKLLFYSDRRFEEDMKAKIPSSDQIYYSYARSFWNKLYPLSDSLLRRTRQMLNDNWTKQGNQGLHNQSLLIIATLRYFDKGTKEYQKAIDQLTSIYELAIADDVNGIRWKDIADAEDITNSSEETIALIAEAFSEGGIHPEVLSGMIKWILNAKSDDHWSSTKATAAVIGILSKENKTVIGNTQTLSARISNHDYTVTDDLLKGNSFVFVKENQPRKVELKKQGSGPASGNLIYYYFTANPVGNKETILKKELFRYNQSINKWELVNGSTSLKIADKIKAELTIETSKALRYVYIDDKRAAAFEIRDIQSGHKYGQGFSYYLSVRDAGIQFFSELIPAGRSTISYEMTVAHEGNFVNGPASLQCMYKPEVNGYSNSMMVQTGK